MTIRPSDTGAVLIGAVLKWGGFAGAAACLLLRYVEPAPRWDVLACMGVSVLGLLVARAGAWRAARGTTAAAGLPESARPGSPVGFRARGSQGLERGQYRRVGALLVLLAVALLLFGSASHVTPQLADARSGSARVEAVTVDKVLSHSSTAVRGGGMSHTSELAVTPAEANDAAAPSPARDGTPRGTTLRGTIKTSESLGQGDRLWALYVPERGAGSGPQDAQLAETRDELTQLRDGTTTPGPVLLAVSGAAAAGGLALLLRRRSPSLHDGTAAVTEALGTGNAQALAVTLHGTAEQTSRALGPGLRLTAEDGERRLHLDRSVDLEHLADALWGRTAWLYWERPGDVVPPGRPGRKGELLPAVLVLGEGPDARYVSGWMPRTPEWPVAQGRRMGPTDPESCPEARPAGPAVLRRVRPRAGAVVWWGLAVLAAAAAMAFPIGGGDQFLTQTLVVLFALCGIVGQQLSQAKRRPSARRQSRRRA